MTPTRRTKPRTGETRRGTTKGTGGATRSPAMPADIRSLTSEDARALKLAIAVIIGEPPNTRNLFLDTLRDMATPHEKLDQTLDKLSRLQIDGKRLMRAERKHGRRGEEIEFVVQMEETDVPGGGAAVLKALVFRFCALVGTPVSPDERESAAKVDDLDPYLLKRIAATVRIAPRETSIH